MTFVFSLCEKCIYFTPDAVGSSGVCHFYPPENRDSTRFLENLTRKSHWCSRGRVGTIKLIGIEEKEK